MLKLDFYMQVYFTFILIYGTIYSRFQITSITFYSHRCTKVENVDLLQNFLLPKFMELSMLTTKATSDS